MTRTRLHLVLFCASVLVTVLPEIAAAQTTALVFQSESGDSVGGGISRSWTSADGNFTVTRNQRNGISAAVDGIAFGWYLHFSLPDNRQITPGHYTGATRYPSTPFVGMSVSGSGPGCTELTGRYLVREVAYGPTGDVLRFAVDVEQHCNNATPALFAALRFNSTVSLDMFPGTTSRFSLSMTVSPGGVVTGGGLACGSGDIACSTIFTSATPVTLVASPLDGYVFDGWSGGCAGGSTALVTVNTVRECAAAFTPATPVRPRTRLSFSSAPGDYIGQGSEQLHSFVNSRWSLVRSNDGNDLTFKVAGLGATAAVEWSLELRAPAGGVLQPGYFANASRAAVRTSSPGLDFHGNGRACSTVAGEFTVHQYVRDPGTGEVVAFAADFTQRCENLTAPPLTGRIEYWATYQVPTLCQTPDPFGGLGGGTCHNGGWLPPGMAIPGGSVATPPPPPPPLPGPTTPSLASCATPDPFSALGGGTCYDGGWLPPGMPVPSGGTPTPPPPPPPAATPTPPPASGGCTTSDPFAVLGGGTCYNGGWLPPGMPIPGGGGQP